MFTPMRLLAVLFLAAAAFGAEPDPALPARLAGAIAGAPTAPAAGATPLSAAEAALAGMATYPPIRLTAEPAPPQRVAFAPGDSQALASALKVLAAADDPAAQPANPGDVLVDSTYAALAPGPQPGGGL